MLAAEIARIEGRELEAERLYEEAIHSAREDGFAQIEAIAAERAARFHESRGIRTVALYYLANARHCYQRWGAHAKTRRLERSNPHLPASDPLRDPLPAPDVPLQQLDVAALFKASRALSGEIMLEALIRALMRVVIEHAAAERGILFLMRDEAAKPVAEARLGPRGVDVTVWEGGGRGVEYSRPILNYVVRTRTSFSSADAAGDVAGFADRDPRENARGSLHCLPIVTQTKLLGVLYLESPGVADAFTPQRAAVLDLLAAQAAISLENARLYAELRRGESFLAEGQRMSQSGSWSWDAETGRLLWSREHYRIFGMDPEGGKAPTVAGALRAVHPEDRVGLRRALLSAVRKRAEFAAECRLIRPDGARHLRLVGRPELDKSGDIEGYVGTTIDMSDSRRAQEALQAAESELARASRLAAIGELTSLIVHEVRQPLTAIAADAGACRSWLARDPPDLGEATASTARIAEEARRANSVMESIRRMTSKSTPDRAPVDVNEVITETVALLGGEFRRRSVVARADLARDLRPVLADRVQLQQVVMNLLMNGMEAMAAVDDRPRLLCSTTRAEPRGTVVVGVADVGVGLPPDGTDRLFDAFFTTKPDGLGVGLAVCRSIVEAHGGALWATPNHPRGSVFRFTLPESGSTRAS